MFISNKQIELLKLELKRERERALASESRVKTLDERLRSQAQQEAMATQVVDNAIAELEKQCQKQKGEIASLQSSRSPASVSALEPNNAIITVPTENAEIENLKSQIKQIKTNLETSMDSDSTTLRDELSQFNVEFESFVSENDQTHSDSFLISVLAFNFKIQNKIKGNSG